MAVRPHEPRTTVQVGGIRRHDHPCFVSGDEHERATVTPGFVRDGLEHGDKVLYLAEDSGPVLARVTAMLGEAGIDVAGRSANGQLVIAGAEDTYLADGRMDALDRAHAGRAEENAVFRDGEVVIRRRPGDAPGLGPTCAVGESGHTPLAMALDAAVAEGATDAADLDVDLSGLDFIDLEGLRLLVTVRQEVGDGRVLLRPRPSRARTPLRQGHGRPAVHVSRGTPGRPCAARAQAIN
jgi:hypothetical protein